MVAIGGLLLVIFSIGTGYWMEGGNFSVVFQPAEVLILVGAATGALILSSTFPMIRQIIAAVISVFTGKEYHKEDYLEMLMLLNDIFHKITREGL